MKLDYNNKYHKKYKYLKHWRKKQVTTKVRKYFMQPDEFIGIYNLYMNIKTKEDCIFVINMIETSKTYKHYKTNDIHFRNDYFAYQIIQSGSLQHAIHKIKNHLNFQNSVNFHVILNPIIEWLFSHTIHTNSLNSVTFK